MNRRIAIPIIGSSDWIGGVCYVENLIKAVRSLPEDAQPEVFLLYAHKDLPALPLHQHFMGLFTGLIRMGTGAGPPEVSGIPTYRCDTPAGLTSLVDFVFPMPDPWLEAVPGAAWIPDFQHVHLPQFFSAQEIKERDASFTWKAAHAKAVVLSSEDAASDFRRCFPSSAARVRVLPFYTLPEPAWFQGDAAEVQRKYRLPERFLLCSNQFWAHKNHIRLFEAVAHLKLKGKPVSLVCTGSTKDYRHAAYFQEIMRMLPELEIGGEVHVLGNIPRADQIQLMRRCLAVVQPSLFEGWSTVVEDARALGKTIFLSDLAVHKEQSPEGAVFFSKTNAQSLVEALESALPRLAPGPDRAAEAVSEREAHSNVLRFAIKFCQLANEL